MAANDPNDKKRPLTAHGRHQATSIGRWMAKNFVPIDAIFSSSAKRAKQTAEICAEAAGLDLEVFLSDDLYDADVYAYLTAIKALADDIRSVLFVGHNPEISGVVRALTKESVGLENSVLVSITFPIFSWVDIHTSVGKIDCMKTPN